ncbi:MAG TPA: hypothetical protein VMG10_32865 [Gemmataceae bacterium]|nr:hypothetical protein [Gemmataceae bacterium]
MPEHPLSVRTDAAASPGAAIAALARLLRALRDRAEERRRGDTEKPNGRPSMNCGRPAAG